VKKQLNTAANTIGETERRSRAMERKLRVVESLPEGEASDVLGLTGLVPETDDVFPTTLLEIDEDPDA
jgi:DNA recombination protein RmuC